MRTIKFRGKRVDTGKWVYGYYFQKPQYQREEVKHYIYTIAKEFDNETLDFVYNTYLHEVIPETVGQFIELMDKGSNEIYEGDIVKSHLTYISPKIVSYEAPQFYPFVGEYFVEGWDNEDCEVIGNIHDNPELVEVK